MRKLLLSIILLFFTLQPITAQALLELGQLTNGELTEANPVASYFVALETGQQLKLQVVAVSPGLVLQATLNTATGTLIESIPNSGNSPSIEADFVSSGDGIFRLDISSVNASSGTFVLLMQEITLPEADETLTIDEPTSGTLEAGATILYGLNGDPDSRLILDVTTDALTTLDAQLLNENGSVAASFEAQEDSSQLLIPARRAEYQLKLENTQDTAVGYQITLMPLDGLISTPVPPAATLETVVGTVPPPLPTTCTITPRSTAVNVRVGPDTQFAAFASLPFGTSVIGVARNPEGTWYQVDTGNGLGWVSASVIVSEGPCSSLQVIFIPTPTFNPATAVPTQAPPDAAPTDTAARRCNPREFRYDMDNGAYMVISLPAGYVGEVINYRDGYHTEFVFPTCRAMLWTSLNYTCYDDGGNYGAWYLSENVNLDWNATCGSNTNHDQRGMSFGVR